MAILNDRVCARKDCLLRVIQLKFFPIKKPRYRGGNYKKNGAIMAAAVSNTIRYRCGNVRIDFSSPDKESSVTIKARKVVLRSLNFRDQYPFCKFTVSRSGREIGWVEVEKSKIAGEAKISFLFEQNNWGKYYGKSAVRAVVRDFLPVVATEIGKQQISIIQCAIDTGPNKLDNLKAVKVAKSASLIFDKSVETLMIYSAKVEGPKENLKKVVLR